MQMEAPRVLPSQIQSWKKKHTCTSKQPLIIISALTEVLTHDNTKCWAPARINTEDQPSLFGSWTKYGVSKGLHSPNCTSLALSFTISYWMAEWEIKSCAVFEDVPWSCKNLWLSAKELPNLLQSVTCSGSCLLTLCWWICASTMQ